MHIFKSYQKSFLLILFIVLILLYVNNLESYNQEEVRKEELPKIGNISENVRTYNQTNDQENIENIENAKENNTKCYSKRHFDKRLGLFKIEDILRSKRKPKKGKSIFFHETTCSKTGELKLNARQACAIESAALLNPNSDIFVLFASPVAQSNQNQTGINFNILQALTYYKNIYFRNVNLRNYAHDTPIQKWFDYGILFYSDSIEVHIADLLRLLTLWRWGGTHLDLDIVLKKTLENIKPNFVGAESEIYIANGVINLHHKGIGHEFAERLLEYIPKYYSPYIWNCIGPILLTNLFKKICKIPVTNLMTITRCLGFKVFEPKMFYAIDFNNSVSFFDENRFDEMMILTKESIGIHVWNKFTKDIVVKVGSKVGYGVYAERYCPKIYSSCGDYF